MDVNRKAISNFTVQLMNGNGSHAMNLVSSSVFLMEKENAPFHRALAFRVSFVATSILKINKLVRTKYQSIASHCASRPHPESALFYLGIQGLECFLGGAALFVACKEEELNSF